MSTLQRLNRKIKNTHDLLGVVRTMKSLAAVNIRQFERAVASLEQYRAVVERGWTVLLKTGPAPTGESPGRGDVCLVVGSDQGMCGQFNESLWPFVTDQVTALTPAGGPWRIWSVGEKMRALLADAGLPPACHFAAPASLAAVHGRVGEVIDQIERSRTVNPEERLHVCHHVLGTHGGYAPVWERVLPLDAPWAAERRTAPWPTRCLPMLGGSRKTLFSHLFRQYLFITLYRALVQSLAVENAARLMAMQAAEKNILDLHDALQARYREQRQAGITAELLDIVSGFEALSEKETFP